MKNKIRVVKWLPTLLVTLLGVVALSGTTMAADTVSSAASQVFVINQADKAISAITITNTDGDMTAANDIRIRIPSGIGMIWDTSITTVTCDNVVATPCTNIGTVSYENSSQTLVIDVTFDLTVADSFTISALNYSTFASASDADNLDLCVDGSCTAVEAVDDKTISIDAPTITTGVSKVYYVGSSPTAQTITIQEHATAEPSISTANDIVVKIPSSINLTFDPSDTSVTVAGTDWAKIEVAEGGIACAATDCAVTVTFKQVDGITACTAVAYDCRTMRLPVDSIFSASDDITVTGYTYNLIAGNASSADSLELEVAVATDWGSSAADVDSSTITILRPSGHTVSTAVVAPTNVAAVVTSEGGVKLTWADAVNTNSVKIYKGIAPAPMNGSAAFAIVETGVGEYTDTSVQIGDVVSYVMKTVTTSGETSPSSETVTITVAAGATSVVTPPPAEEPPVEVPPTTEPTPPVDLTYDQEKAQVVDLGIVTTDFDKATNKCEAIVMLARAAGWEIDSTVTEDGFVDTPLWCKPYAAKAKELGVVNGRTATELGVDGEVNRYEIGVMLARVLGATEADMTAAAELTIYDDEIVDWAKGAVHWLHAEGVMTGYPDNTYKGANGILKIELAVALGRAFDLLVAPSVSFHANLVGANGVPAVTTDAAGSCYVSLAGSTLTYTCTVEGLDVTAAHFHLGAADENGAVLHAIEFTGNEASGTWTDLTEAQITALNAEGIYVNVHTAANPDGEIRGQVIM